MGLFYGDLFANWEIAITKSLVRKFQESSPWIKGLDFDDLLQECLFHWYLHRGSYREGKGASIRTYMAIVLKNQLQLILREQQADKRKTIHGAISLDECVGESETPLADLITDNQSPADDSLRLDVEAIVRTLTPLQREVCQLLAQEYSVKRLAELLEKPRSTIRDEIKRVREIFSQKGLKDYWQ
ncbi:RNA polymerase sigma factor [Candidatus Omnitrophota bacterium]